MSDSQRSFICNVKGHPLVYMATWDLPNNYSNGGMCPNCGYFLYNCTICGKEDLCVFVPEKGPLSCSSEVTK